jgi:hypothetical protein
MPLAATTATHHDDDDGDYTALWSAETKRAFRILAIL